MKYYHNMVLQYGLGERGATPPDAFACRSVYIRAINKLAEAYRSSTRAVAFNRSCLIFFVKEQALAGHSEHDISIGNVETKDEDLTVPDTAMEIALTHAHALNLDGFVQTTVEIDHKGLNRLLAKQGKHDIHWND